MKNTNTKFITHILGGLLVSGLATIFLIWIISFIPDEFTFKGGMGLLLGVSPLATFLLSFFDALSKNRSLKIALKGTNEWMEKAGILPVFKSKEEFAEEFPHFLAFNVCYIYLLMEFDFSIINALILFSPVMFLFFRNAIRFLFNKNPGLEITSI